MGGCKKKERNKERKTVFLVRSCHFQCDVRLPSCSCALRRKTDGGRHLLGVGTGAESDGLRGRRAVGPWAGSSGGIIIATVSVFQFFWDSVPSTSPPGL